MGCVTSFLILAHVLSPLSGVLCFKEVLMTFTKWKSLRLIWFPWFLFHLYVYVKYSFFVDSPDLLQFIRSSITTLVLVGCLFYSVGFKCFPRLFWQSLFVIAVIDELFGIYEMNEFDVVNYLIISTFYLVLALYAFKNRTIWWQSQAHET